MLLKAIRFLISSSTPSPPPKKKREKEKEKISSQFWLQSDTYWLTLIFFLNPQLVTLPTSYIQTIHDIFL